MSQNRRFPQEDVLIGANDPIDCARILPQT